MQNPPTPPIDQVTTRADDDGNDLVGGAGEVRREPRRSDPRGRRDLVRAQPRSLRNGPVLVVRSFVETGRNVRSSGSSLARVQRVAA